MFRGSAYSIETDKDITNHSELMQEDIKIALIGIPDVGKSSMLACIEDEPFNEDIDNTKSFQLRFKKLRINNVVIRLSIWDGAGENITDFMQKGQFSTVDGFIEIFDLTDKQSFHQLEGLHEELKKYLKRSDKPFISLLVGNKADLTSECHSQDLKITQYLANKLAKNENMLYLKVSAKQNQFVKDSFIELIKLVLRSRKKHVFEHEDEVISGRKCPKCNLCNNLCHIF